MNEKEVIDKFMEDASLHNITVKKIVLAPASYDYLKIQIPTDPKTLALEKKMKKILMTEIIYYSPSGQVKITRHEEIKGYGQRKRKSRGKSGRGRG